MAKPVTTRKPAPVAVDPQEHRWTQIIQSLEEGVIGADSEGRILSMNQAAEQLTGCAIAAARGRHHTQVFADAGWVSELLEGVLGGDQGSLSAEGTIHGLWQKPIPVRASVSAILDSHARRVGAALILQNLTLQRELETDVRRSQSLAQLGVMVAGLAHEIRNPLGGIRGAVQLLAAEVGDASTGREYIELTLREVDRLTKLLEQLLELRPRGRFVPQAVNIHRVIDHVIALVEDGAKREQTAIHRFFDPSLPEVSGDPDALTQLLLNLVQNALQAVAALPEGAARQLRLTTRVETDYHLSASRRGDRGRGRLLRVDVEDTGPGIPADVQPNVFSPFVTTKPKGTGLGLAICQRIVADHGGTIRFESERGKTLFRVTLPAWEEATGAASRRSSGDV